MEYLFKKDDHKRCFHIYYSDFKKAKERSKLQQKIRGDKEVLEGLRGTEAKLDRNISPYFDLIYHKEDGKEVLQYVREREDVISRAIKLCGYFCIITSRKMTAEEALDLYKSRDCSEKLFRGDKSYLGERTMRVYKDEPTHAKIFIEFVALIIRNKIYTCLKDRMKEIKKKKNYMTVPAALKELDKIELIRQADKVYRLDHAITATQKDILQGFNISGTKVLAEAKKLGKEISELTQ
jgi:transposase